MLAVNSSRASLRIIDFFLNYLNEQGMSIRGKDRKRIYKRENQKLREDILRYPLLMISFEK